jgi:hypothetical protein
MVPPPFASSRRGGGCLIATLVFFGLLGLFLAYLLRAPTQVLPPEILRQIQDRHSRATIRVNGSEPRLEAEATGTGPTITINGRRVSP